MAAEIAAEIAKGRSRLFNVRATALMLCRAAIVDQAFRARLAACRSSVPARSRGGCWGRSRRSSATSSTMPSGYWAASDGTARAGLASRGASSGHVELVLWYEAPTQRERWARPSCKGAIDADQ